MAAVQFFGIQSVMDAFGLSPNAVAWAVFSGNYPVTTGTDGGQLQAFLTMLQPGGSAAEYELRIYSALDENEEIDNKTPFATRFRFKLNEPAAASMGGFGMRAGMDPITAELHGYLSKKVSAAIKKELEGPEEDEDEGDTSIGGFINTVMKGLAKDPEKLVGVIRDIKDIFTGRPAVGMPVSVAGVAPGARTGNPVRAGQVSGEEKMQRIAAAFDRLEACDPDFLKNIEKLAEMAEKKPAMYKMAVQMLNDI